jgi:hypothetical protein
MFLEGITSFQMETRSGEARSGPHLFIDLAHHHRLDGRQQFGDGDGANPKGSAQLQRGTHIQADHSTSGHTKLTAEALDQIPDLPALIGAWRIQDLRAVFAALRAGLAVVGAPTELPLGKGGEAFFSVSRIMARAMYLV